MKTSACLLLVAALLALPACERKNGAPPKPVTSSLAAPMAALLAQVQARQIFVA